MIYYIYGGMMKSHKTKLHICDDYATVLCGVKSNWMEAGSELLNNGLIEGMEHLSDIHDDKDVCTRCYNKWSKINPRTISK